MQEDKSVQFQDLDQVLYNAQLRRSADLGLWLRKYLEARRQRRLQTESAAQPTASNRA
jgi:hypothetical protein